MLIRKTRYFFVNIFKKKKGKKDFELRNFYAEVLSLQNITSAK